MLEVSWFIGGFLCFLVYNYIFRKLINNSNKLNCMFVLFAFLNGILYFLLTKYDYVYLRPYFVNILLFISLIVIHNQKMIKTLVIFIYIFILMCISEFVFGFFAIFIFKINIQNLVSVWYGYLISNILIYLFMLVISNVTIVKKIALAIIDWQNRNEYKIYMICILLIMIITTFFLYNNYIEALPRTILFVTNIFSIAVMYFVISYFKEKSSNNRIINEYDQLLTYVQRYEKVVEEKSKNQHEYKNQLVMLKSMISKSNKKAIDYIDGLYNESKDDNDVELLKKLKYLPSGGLKGLIYYKIEEMQDKGINVFVDISSELKNVKVNKKIDKNLKDISRVIGVYMDNAIEATIESKEKYIILEVYIKDNEWVFSLSNTYSNKVNIYMVDQEGYTTKGEGKGYGLSLVKDIIEHNKDLRQEKELNGIYYTQRLYMKK